MIIGSHVGFSNGLLGSVNEALSYDANTFMFYTGAPQNTIRKSIDLDNTKIALEVMNDKGIDINNVICHAPYIINLANNEKETQWRFSIDFLKNEINRCKILGVKYIVVHPGSSVKLSHEDGLNNIVRALNEVIDDEVMILLETMAGKGSECGYNTLDIKYILDNVTKSNIGVCIDTCHLNDSGIDLKYFDDYLDDFDKNIGINRIHCMHVNDSLNVIGSKKDRHANIGYGTIGFDVLIDCIYNERLKDIPKILETPYVNGKAPYKIEIEEIRNKKFYNDLEKRID